LKVNSVIRFFCAVLLLSGVASAGVDACAVVPSVDIASMLGTTKNKGITDKLKLPPKATEGKVCTYVGKDNSATVIWIKFPTPAAARDYLSTVRDGFEKQSLKTTTEKFGAEDGFSFNSGMLAVKKSIWLRVNVNSTAGKVLVPDLTRQLMTDALRAN
jgi:hypothetical protein